MIHWSGNNGAASKDLQELNLANPAYSLCYSHTVNLSAKEFSKSCALINKIQVLEQSNLK